MIRNQTKTSFKPDEALRQLTQSAVESGYSISLWRKPMEADLHLIMSQRAELISNVNLEESGPGFLFSPFNKSEKKIFLPADHYYVLKSEEIVPKIQGEIFIPKKLVSEKIPFFFRQNNNQLDSSIVQQEQDYRMLISDCIHHIRSGRFEKIVPSRKKKVQLPENADPLDLFNKLSKEYPNAFVSLISTPYSGTWIGATPEPLISLDQHGVFKTVALAGTQRFDPTVAESQVSWKQKEIEEQALVQRYIINCFKKIRLREFTEAGPKTIRAGNLLHLRTDFMVNINEVRYPDLATIMLDLLHPTSAVCGMPLEPALDYLIRHEGYQREFYSGYLGPVGLDGETHLFVNLRCMKWEGTHAWLFAGAGVTADSIPDDEFMESELKMQTLLRLTAIS